MSMEERGLQREGESLSDGQNDVTGSTVSSMQAAAVKDGPVFKPDGPVQFNYLSGWRLHVSTLVFAIPKHQSRRGKHLLFLLDFV